MKIRDQGFNGLRRPLPNVRLVMVRMTEMPMNRSGLGSPGVILVFWLRDDSY